MRLGTPRGMQGQIVERSYGWCMGEYYMRIHDRSCLSTQWYRADRGSRDRLADSSYEAGGDDYPPDVDEWTLCNEPKEG